MGTITMREKTDYRAGLEKTLVAWRRLGKEHKEGAEFRLNPPDVVTADIQRKIELYRQTPLDDWRWWQLSDELIVEKPPTSAGFSPDAIIYYLPHQNWVIVENAGVPSAEWRWYVHIGQVKYHASYDSWIFTDLFCDIIVKNDNRTHSVLDLDELGHALELGLLTTAQLVQILADTQELINLVRSGNFPPQELRSRQKIIDKLGWNT